MRKKLLCIILSFFLITTIFLNSIVNAVEIDANHFLLRYGGTEQKVFRNFPSQYYNAETDLFFIYNNLKAFVLKGAKTGIENGGTLVTYWSYSAYIISMRTDDGSGYKYTDFYNANITELVWNSLNDKWDFVSNNNYIKNFTVGSNYIYSPVIVYQKDIPSSVAINKTGFIGNPPYIANTYAQLQGLTVGEVSIVPNEAAESSLTLSLYNNTTDSVVFTQYLKNIDNLSDYVSRVDIDDPFSDLAYNLPWQIFPEFDFVEGNEYQLMLNYSTNVDPITRTFIVSKSINNKDIPLSNPPATLTPTPTPDPNQGLIDSNKETQNILNDQTNAIKENTETNKNIFQKIGDILNLLNPLSENFFVYKLLELLFEGLKTFILPSSDFISNYFNELSSWFQERLGFLWTPFDIVNTFLERLNNNELFVEPIIHIPNITEPFTGQQIISATDYNLKSILEKDNFNTMYNVYLVIVDFVIYLGVLTLCYNTLVGVFRGSPDSITVAPVDISEDERALNSAVYSTKVANIKQTMAENKYNRRKNK